MHWVPGGTTPVLPFGQDQVVVVRQVITAVPPQACPPREGATPVQSWRGRSVGVALGKVVSFVVWEGGEGRVKLMG